MVGADVDPSLTADEAGQLAMLQIVLVGLGAGAAAALLFASVASGSILATLLFYLAPLPILIAALGWSHWAGLIAGLTAAAGLGAIARLVFLQRIPGRGGVCRRGGSAISRCWRVRLAANGSMSLEWYPVGRLVLWAAIVGAVLVIVAIPNFGTDKESFQAGLRAAFERAIQIQIAPGRPCVRRRSRAPDRHPGGSDPAGGGGARDPHQCLQSVACGTHRPRVGTTAAAVARPLCTCTAIDHAGVLAARDRRLVSARSPGHRLPASWRRACSWPTPSSALRCCMPSRAA